MFLLQSCCHYLMSQKSKGSKKAIKKDKHPGTAREREGMCVRVCIDDSDLDNGPLKKGGLFRCLGAKQREDAGLRLALKEKERGEG